MSYAGHVLDMISRFNENREARMLIRERYRELREQYYFHHINHPPATADRKKLSDAELQILIEKIRREIRREKIRVRLISTVLTLLIGGILALMLLRKIQD